MVMIRNIVLSTLFSGLFDLVLILVAPVQTISLDHQKRLVPEVSGSLFRAVCLMKNRTRLDSTHSGRWTDAVQGGSKFSLKGLGKKIL